MSGLADGNAAWGGDVASIGHWDAQSQKKVNSFWSSVRSAG
jgi:hypothetical protein